MNYKLKIEIDPGFNSIKSTRDVKLDLLHSDIENEIEIGPGFEIPKKGDFILINDNEYKIKRVIYQITKNDYFIILRIVPMYENDENDDIYYFIK